MNAAVSPRLLALLSRDTSSGRFISEIDGLRFIAIGAVVAYHIGDFTRTKLGHAWRDSDLGLFISHGYFGVPLFFVISGFIISLPFIERITAGSEPLSLRKYFVRRVSRLEPPYLINLAVLFVLLVLVKGMAAGDLAPHLLASSTYTHNVIYGEFSRINFVAWSLEIEFQFYVLAPFLVQIFRIGRVAVRRVLLVSLILGFGLLAGPLIASPNTVGMGLLIYLPYFLAGFLLADVHVTDWSGEPVRRTLPDLVSVAAWGALAAMLYAPDRFRAILPLVILVAYWAAFRGRASSWLFSRPFVYVIGGMCYTIYLWHFYVISAVGNPALALLDGSGLSLTGIILAMLLVLSPIVVVSGAVLFALFEKPFMRRGWYNDVAVALRSLGVRIRLLQPVAGE